MALKLTDSDKKTIVELYQHPEESTATLASRYAVSSSTISRILKQALSPTEYQKIVQQKKGGGSKPQSRQVSPPSEPSQEAPSKPKATQSSSPAKPKLKSTTVSAAPSDDESTPSKPKRASNRGRTRQRSSAKKAKPTAVSEHLESSIDTPESVVQLTTDDVLPNHEKQQVEDIKSQSPHVPTDVSLSEPELELDSPPDELVHEIQSDLLGEDFDDDDADDIGDDDIDDGELDDDGTIDLALELPLSADHLSILPFSEAKLPRTCYIIIDRSAELITRPLKTFADLGTVPEEEINEPTLPIFDNHRVAKRFANKRTQRIVKVPDAQVLHKTSSYLMDKGITRLLLDGQVYALIDEDEEIIE